MLVFDRGYADYEWFRRLTRQQVYFVTRLKDKADYGLVEERELPRRKGVLRDQVIFFYPIRARQGVFLPPGSSTNREVRACIPVAPLALEKAEACVGRFLSQSEAVLSGAGEPAFWCVVIRLLSRWSQSHAPKAPPT
jgi:hypothetical protein